MVDAYHIFCSDNISNEQLDHGQFLLDTFVDDFERLYGGQNMVFNIHLARHIFTCVKKNGPQFTYSAYNMENNIGYLVASFHGTTDVIKQISERYLRELNLRSRLKDSPKANEYFNLIQPYQMHNKFLKKSNLSPDEKRFIGLELNALPAFEYENLVVNGDFYRVNIPNHSRITDDSFVLTKNGAFGRITSIFQLANNLIYFLVQEDYLVDLEYRISRNITFLKKTEDPIPRYYIVNLTEIGKKTVFIEFDNILAYSSLPNNIEGN